MWHGAGVAKMGSCTSPSTWPVTPAAAPASVPNVGKGMPVHLFISHSTRDGAAIAQQLSQSLEAAGHRCWIAPRDVRPGVPYPGQIVGAIRDCAGLVLIVTPAANESPDVLQEVQLAGQHRKTVAPVVVNRTTPSDDLHYYLGVRHQIAWSDARVTTAELMRSFPAPSAVDEEAQPKQGKGFAEAVKAFSERPAAWAPSMPMSHAPDTGERFDVFMIAHGPNKINVIKVIREYTGLGLAETKTLIDSSLPPIRVGLALPRARAEALIKDLHAVGAMMLDPAPHKAA
jgi:ribosomal protein L7/L12